MIVLTSVFLSLLFLFNYLPYSLSFKGHNKDIYKTLQIKKKMLVTKILPFSKKKKKTSTSNSNLTLSKTTNFGLFRSKTVCRRQFLIWWK